MLVTNNCEDVTQIKLSRYPETTPVSAYLVDGLLVDTGLAYTAEELTGFLQARKVKTVVNTHYHEDHIGGNHLLHERLGIEFFAHKIAVERINQPAKLYPYQELVWGYPVPTRVNVIGESISTDLHRFEVIHTPGHSPDHICLLERERGWLFAGDLFHSTHPVVARPEEDQKQIIQSLRLVIDLKPRLLFTAPANVVAEPESVLDGTVQYLEQLGQKIRELHNRGLTPPEIRREIFGDEHPAAARTQEQFSHLNLILGFMKDGD